MAATRQGLGARAAAADVVVLDTMGLDRSGALRDVVAGVDAPVVAVGVPDDEPGVIAFAELGVLGFVERDAMVDELVASIESASRGEASCPPRIATTLLRRITSLAAHRAQPDAAGLTARERQVVRLIAEGMSNKEIATRLCIEPATVKNHVHNILEKLQVTRRSEAAARLQVIEGGSAYAPVPSTGSSAG